MALTEAQKIKIKEEEEYRLQVSQPATNKAAALNRTHGLPALLSFFIVGLGQIIKGDVLKGILFFVGFIIGLFVFVVPGILIWLWNIYDAYNSNANLKVEFV